MIAWLRRHGGGAQVLRGILGFAFPYALASVPSDIHYTGPLVGGGVLAYIAARWLVLAEPYTLTDLGWTAIGHWGEAIFVTLGLTMALIVLDESSILEVGPGPGIIIVIGYLIAHILVLPLMARWALDGAADRPERPMLRRFIRGASFVAGEAVALMLIVLAVHDHDVARSGPGWGVWDVLPLMELVVLVIGYTPIVWLEMAATRERAERSDEVGGAVEASLVQASAVLVAALTGRAPWL